ncbi:MAG: LPS translocon maturation chaperone LptM [Beijerinckiaceae bacterium]
MQPAARHPSIYLLAPVLLGVIALALAGCGRRGPLEAPPGAPAAASAQNQSPRLAPAGVGSRQNIADRDPLSRPPRTGDLEEDEPPIPAPKRPFILDPIL